MTSNSTTSSKIRPLLRAQTWSRNEVTDEQQDWIDKLQGKKVVCLECQKASSDRRRGCSRFEPHFWVKSRCVNCAHFLMSHHLPDGDISQSDSSSSEIVSSSAPVEVSKALLARDASPPATAAASTVSTAATSESHPLTRASSSLPHPSAQTMSHQVRSATLDKLISSEPLKVEAESATVKSQAASSTPAPTQPKEVVSKDSASEIVSGEEKSSVQEAAAAAMVSDDAKIATVSSLDLKEEKADEEVKISSAEKDPSDPPNQIEDEEQVSPNAGKVLVSEDSSSSLSVRGSKEKDRKKKEKEEKKEKKKIKEKDREKEKDSSHKHRHRSRREAPSSNKDQSSLTVSEPKKLPLNCSRDDLDLEMIKGGRNARALSPLSARGSMKLNAGQRPNLGGETSDGSSVSSTSAVGDTIKVAEGSRLSFKVPESGVGQSDEHPSSLSGSRRRTSSITKKTGALFSMFSKRESESDSSAPAGASTNSTPIQRRRRNGDSEVSVESNVSAAENPTATFVGLSTDPKVMKAAIAEELTLYHSLIESLNDQLSSSTAENASLRSKLDQLTAENVRLAKLTGLLKDRLLANQIELEPELFDSSRSNSSTAHIEATTVGMSGGMSSSSSISTLTAISASEMAPDTPRMIEQKLAKREKIIQELLQTERNYVGGLELIVTDVYGPLMEESKKEQPLVTRQNIIDVFGQVEIIQRLSKIILEDLETRISTGPSGDWQVGETFTKLGPFLKSYRAYVINYASALQLLAKLKRDRGFRELLARLLTTKTKTKGSPYFGYDIDAFLITPVQRVPRYVILLQQLLANTPQTHPDFESVRKALVTVEQAAASNELAHKDITRIQKMADLQADMIDNTELMAPTRRIVFDLDVHAEVKTMGDGRKVLMKRKVRKVVLFNDSLRIMKILPLDEGSARTRPQLRLLATFDLTKATALHDQTVPGNILLVIGPRDRVRIELRSLSELTEWLKVIADARSKK